MLIIIIIMTLLFLFINIFSSYFSDTYSYFLQREHKFSKNYADMESFKVLGIISKQIADLKELRSGSK